MIDFYVTQIKLHQFDGLFTIEDVPACWKEKVEEALEQNKSMI